jgi:hypothetical protein
MSLFNKVREQLFKNKENAEKGIFNGIPYPYAKLNEHLVSIDKGTAIGILGGTGLGKSKFTRYTFLYSIYKFYKETGYKCKVLLFCMEDSKERTMNFVICHYLKEVHNIIVTVKELNSRGRILPRFIKEKLLEAEEYFNEFEQIVTFVDGITEPSKLYKICENVAVQLGTLKPYKEIVEGVEIEQVSYQSDTHVIAIFDNMSNIDMEDEDSNEQKAILKFCKEYMRLRLCNFFNWTTVMVMQLDFESERASFTKAGDVNVAKLEPSLASIGDSKRASRSFHLIFSLFSPQRHDIISYPQPTKLNPDNYYRIDILGNSFRSLRVIKANDTDVGMRVGLLFDGIGETFTELPPPTDHESLAKIYEKFNNKTKFTKTTNIVIEQEPDELPF